MNDVKIPRPTIVVEAPLEEEDENQIVEIQGKHILLGGVILLVLICAGGYFILHVRHKLQKRQYQDIIKTIPDALYAASHLIQTVSDTGMMGAGAPSPKLAPPPPPSTEMFSANN